MKRYIYLFLGTAAIISAVVMSGYLITKNIANVYVYTVLQEDVDNTVSVQGKIQYASEKSVSINCNAVINKIFVDDGDYVNKNDKLFSYYEIDEAVASISISDYSDLTQISSIINNDSSIVEDVKDNLELKTMYAKSDGIISGISVSEGDYAESTDKILKITDKSSFEIPVNINETVISDIQLNQQVKVAFPALENKTFTGTVSEIAAEAKQTTGLTGKETTVETIISIDKDSDELRVGYTANCSIITSTEYNALIVPYECVRTDDGGEYVYVVSEQTAYKKYIETGKEYKDGVLAKSGVQNGDVLVKNCDSIYDGQSVNIIDEENSDE